MWLTICFSNLQKRSFEFPLSFPSTPVCSLIQATPTWLSCPKGNITLEVFLSSTSGSWVFLDLDSSIFAKPWGLLAFPLQPYEFLHQLV